MLPAMTSLLNWIMSGAIGPAAISGLAVKIARKPALLFLVTLAFVVSAILSLALSGLVFRDWWQGFFLELGVGLLIAGTVDVAVLGALHGLIEGDESKTDSENRLVRTLTGASVDLTRTEFDAVRRLLEDQQTWSLAGQGTIEDLAAQIASCLPPRDGRTAEDSRAAALVIARGLLEFAVIDLDPKLSQQLLLTRLQRMKTDQANALDEALLHLRADLIARLTVQEELGAQRFTSVMGHFERVLDRLPPGAGSTPGS